MSFFLLFLPDVQIYATHTTVSVRENIFESKLIIWCYCRIVVPSLIPPAGCVQFFKHNNLSRKWIPHAIEMPFNRGLRNLEKIHPSIHVMFTIAQRTTCPQIQYPLRRKIRNPETSLRERIPPIFSIRRWLPDHWWERQKYQLPIKIRKNVLGRYNRLSLVSNKHET